MNQFQCFICGQPWTEIDEAGLVKWSKPCRDCPARWRPTPTKNDTPPTRPLKAEGGGS